MNNIPEVIRGKLISVGYNSIDQLPNDKDMGRWNAVKTDCGLTIPERDELMNIRFPQGPAGGGLQFVPAFIVTQITVDSIPHYIAVPANAEDMKSAHCSQIFVNEAVRDWFHRDIVRTIPWEIEAPGVLNPNASRNFEDYIDAIHQMLNLKVIPIEQNNHAYGHLDIVSRDKMYRATLSGRADYMIVPLNCTKSDFLYRLVCIIEIQSGEKTDVVGEAQLESYLLILMNKHGMKNLVGVYITKTKKPGESGLCKMYKASRSENNDCIYEVDHQFHVSLLGDVLADVLPKVVN